MLLWTVLGFRCNNERRFRSLTCWGHSVRFTSLISFVSVWWYRATWGTWVFTFRRGQPVGQDVAGNRYYQEKGRPEVGRYHWERRRRWVIYADVVDGSMVPPEWNAWLQHNADEAPTAPSLDHAWEQPHMPNMTGTPGAYRPAGHVLGAGSRKPASADYEPWQPN
jgi:NADH:ubiquinone oxidoreductase subunit